MSIFTSLSDGIELRPRLSSFTCIIAMLLGYPVLTPLAFAQGSEAEAEADNRDVEEIIVTGSRIKRRDFFTPSPLMTISSEDIEFTGQATIEEALNQMPQVTPDYGRASNNPGSGTATVALRSLGPGRTLVLLNGRRIGASGSRSAVDLNNIPQALIERVEIITGGTSAVYGSDALAGVVNFITRQDFSGFSLDASMNMTEYRDAESYDLNMTYGHNFGNGRGNVTLYAGTLRREASWASSREHTAVAWQEDWEGNLVEGGSPATPSLHIIWPPAYFTGPPEDPERFATFEPNGNPREFLRPDDLYNYAPENYLQIPLERLSAGIMTNYELSDRFDGYLEASYTQNEPGANLAPVPAFGWFQVNLDNPVLTPAARDLFTERFTCDVNLACIYIGKRLLELGPRIIDSENTFYRVTAGMRGELGNDWEIDGWLGYTKASTLELLRNDASRSRLQQGLLVDPVTNECYDPSGGCVPLNVFGENNLSPEGTDFLRFQPFENPTERIYRLANVFVTGSPLSTWAGAVDIAVGLEWRSDESEFSYDEALFEQDQLGFNGHSPGGGYDSVTEMYFEALVPLASDLAWATYLGLDIGARYSDYKHAGGVWSYKAGLEWQPIQDMRFRAMHQRSVRAPNSFELFEEQRSFIGTPLGKWDNCSAAEDPIGHGYLDKCVMQGLPADQVGIWQASDFYPLEFIEGGNTDLETEVGHTLTVGVVLEPRLLPNWTLAIDYYDLEVEAAIGPIDVQDVCFDLSNTSHAFCDRIIRDQSGHRAQILEITENRGLMQTAGFDVQAQYHAGLPDFFAIGNHSANIGVNIIWTHLLEFEDQESPASQVADCAGYFGGVCDTVSSWGGDNTTYTKNRVTTSIHYAAGPLALHMGWRWIDGTNNALWYFEEWDEGEDLAIKSVGDKQYVDLGASYVFSDHVSARLGVNNVFDSEPPNMSSQTFDNNTDTGLYDVFGRSYYLSLSMHY